MSSVARDLLHEIAPGRADANPLGLLGLSSEILDLGLTPDELYSVCQKIARVLLAEVHEDRAAVTTRTAYLQRRFSGAMQVLKTRPAFDAALAGLRRTRARDSEITTTLRRALAAEKADHAQSVAALTMPSQREIQLARQLAAAVAERNELRKHAAEHWLASMKRANKHVRLRVQGLRRMRQELSDSALSKRLEKFKALRKRRLGALKLLRAKLLDEHRAARKARKST